MHEDIIREEQRIADERIQRASKSEAWMLRRPIRELPDEHPAIRVNRHDKIRDVLAMMADHRLDGVLVVEQERLVGVCSKSHIFSYMAADDLDIDQTNIEDIMRAEPICLKPDDELAHALHQIYVGEYDLVPLVDELGKPSGVVSMRDIVGYLVDLFPQDILNLPPSPAHGVASKPEGA